MVKLSHLSFEKLVSLFLCFLFSSSWSSHKGKSIRVSKVKSIGIAKGVCGGRELNLLHFRKLQLDSRGSSMGETIVQSCSGIGDRARDQSVKLVLSLLQLNQSSISRSVCFNWLEGSSFVFDLLFHYRWNGLNTKSPIQQLRSSIGSNSKGEDNQELHV